MSLVNVASWALVRLSMPSTDQKLFQWQEWVGPRRLERKKLTSKFLT